VATNQMRREAAKRKLERQQERRAQQAKRRRKVAARYSGACGQRLLYSSEAKWLSRNGSRRA
jgi:hypothetical protein